MIDLQAVQAAYPDPRRAIDDDGSEDSYCVGGALCLYSDFKANDSGIDRFPDFGYFSYVLEQLNPALQELKHYDMAMAILTANDRGEFAEAWKLMGEALIWQNTA